MAGVQSVRTLMRSGAGRDGLAADARPLVSLRRAAPGAGLMGTRCPVKGCHSWTPHLTFSGPEPKVGKMNRAHVCRRVNSRTKSRRPYRRGTSRYEDRSLAALDGTPTPQDRTPARCVCVADGSGVPTSRRRPAYAVGTDSVRFYGNTVHRTQSLYGFTTT